jgi:hypothetical protein
MSLFERATLKWREPKEFLELHQKYESARARWWARPGAALFTAALVFGNWYLSTLDPHKSPVDAGTALVGCLGLGIFLVYVVPLLNRFCPSEVKLYSKCLLKGQGSFNRVVAFKEMASYCWLHNDRFHTLCLTSKKGRRLLIGVDTREHRDIIDRTLTVFGVPCLPDVKE